MLEINTSVLSNYEIIEQIATGSFGVVSKALYIPNSTYVALKAFRLAKKPYEDYMNELKLAFRLNHPNIVKINDIFTEFGINYISYEYINGGNLRDLMEKSPIKNLEDIVKIITDVAKALDHVHGKGIVHRDIKPENILISYENEGVTYKLTDFGVSKFCSADRLLKTLVGSPAYMAPDIYRQAYDSRSDLYSLGVIFYELLFRKRPFSGSYADLMNDHLYKNVCFPQNDISEKIKYILSKLLAKKAESRYQSASELISDLEKVDKKDLYVINYKSSENNRNIFTSFVKPIGNHESLAISSLKYDEENDHILMINNKRMIIYKDNLDISFLFDKKNLKNCFFVNKRLFFYFTNSSIIKAHKVGEETKEEIIYASENIITEHQSDQKNQKIYFLCDNNVFYFSTNESNQINKIKNTEYLTFGNLKKLAIHKDKVIVITEKNDFYFLLEYDSKTFLLDNIVKIENKVGSLLSEKNDFILSCTNFSKKETYLYTFDENGLNKFFTIKKLIVKIRYFNNAIFLLSENGVLVKCEGNIVKKASIEDYKIKDFEIINKELILVFEKNNNNFLTIFNSNNIETEVITLY